MKRVWISLGTVILLSVLLEIIFRHLAHPAFWWHSVPAFDFIYGFLGCVVIVLGSKWVGHKFVQRDEDYYN